MLKLVENIEFIKNRKLEVNKIDEKEFILENKNVYGKVLGITYIGISQSDRKSV